VNDDTKLNGVTIGDVRKMGAISLSKTDHGLVLMPLILLRAINSDINVIHDDMINPLHLSSPQTLEQLLAVGMILRNNSLYDLGIKEASYGDLFPGI
jgi:hypothetical protein